MFKKRKNYSLEISTIIALIISLAIFFASGSIINKTDSLATELLKDKIIVAHEILESTIHESFTQAEIYTKVIASSSRVRNAIESGDKEVFCNIYDIVCDAVDFVVIYDNKGNVLIKTEENSYCNDIENCYIINNGLEDGSSIGISKCNDTNKLNIVVTNVIKNTNGEVIGLVTCGYDLTDPNYINKIKERISYDITIFRDDMRISTTLTDENDQSLTGTIMNPEIAEKVLKNKEIVVEKINLFEHEYIGCYSPIINDNEVIGSLFIGSNIEDVLDEINDAINWIQMILIIIGIFSIIVIFILNIFILSKPLDEFNDIMKNLNKNTKNKKEEIE